MADNALVIPCTASKTVGPMADGSTFNDRHRHDRLVIRVSDDTKTELQLRIHDGTNQAMMFIDPEDGRTLFNALGVWLHTGKLPDG